MLELAAELVGYLNNAIFAALALACFLQWRRRRDASSAWAAVTFGLLALVTVVSLVPDGQDALPDALVKVEIAIICLFPYCLYRFVATFRSVPRWEQAAALALTVGISIWALLLPTLPEEGAPRPGWLRWFLFGFLAQWSLLLMLVAVRLLRAGRGHPTVVRKRMRLLGAGAVAMTAGILLAGFVPQDRPELDLVTSLITLLAVLLFFLGFAPPASVRSVWRRPEQDALNAGVRELIAASTERDVTQTLLPYVVQIAAARSAALVSPEGRTIDAYGEPDPEREPVRFDFPFASLLVWTGPYTPFFGQEELALLNTLGVLTNVALERSRLFSAEKEARLALSQAQALSHLGSFEWSVTEDKVVWSEEMYRIFGLPDGHRVDYASYLERVHPDDRAIIESAVGTALETGAPYEFDHRIIRPDGTVRMLNARGQLVRDEAGRPLKITGTALDVTELRRAERDLSEALEREKKARSELEVVNREMESFLYTVSHDLNNPLVSLVGYLGFLEKDYADKFDDQGRFYLDRMRAGVTYMQALIKDLLQLSRVGRTDMPAEDVPLQPLVESIASELEMVHPQARVVVEDLPVVRINPVRARQLFTNLMQNAARHARRPDVRIVVSVTRAAPSEIEISVRDNGPGIPVKDRERIFGVFERIGPRDRDQEGTGVGLAICRKIVETVGGRIWVADAEEGADMRLTLPPGTGQTNQRVQLSVDA